jgi:hypothetical protein
MNRAENVAEDCKGACLGCREDYRVRFSRQYRDASVEVVCYRETMGLRLVNVAHQEANHSSFLNTHNGPRVSWGSMAYAVIEA